MSVLIRGMEMPKDCRECPMELYRPICGDTTCLATNKLLAEDYKPIPFDGIPDWCPLVEVPEPHGDLIDRDALISQMESDAEQMEEPIAKMFAYAAISDVKHAQIIIEAEGSEDHDD